MTECIKYQLRYILFQTTIRILFQPLLFCHVRRGCPLDEKDWTEEDTPLHLATRNGNNEMVAILLRKGANTDLLNKVS